MFHSNPNSKVTSRQRAQMQGHLAQELNPNLGFPRLSQIEVFRVLFLGIYLVGDCFRGLVVSPKRFFDLGGGFV